MLRHQRERYSGDRKRQTQETRSAVTSFSMCCAENYPHFFKKIHKMYILYLVADDNLSIKLSVLLLND